MAFVTYSEIQEQLPAGHDRSLATRLLKQIERKLKNIGLSFDVLSTDQTLKLNPIVDYQKIFTYHFFQSITSVKIKTYGHSGERVLTEDDDYIVYSLSNYTNIFHMVELINNCQNIRTDQYLEVVATTGFLEETPQWLIDGIVDYLEKRLSKRMQGDQYIIRSKTGDSDTQISEKMLTQVANDPMKDQEFLDVIFENIPELC